MYRIQPNYSTVCLGFLKNAGKTCGKICTNLTKGTLKKRSAKDLSSDAHAMFFSDFLYISICCGYSFELHRQVDA